MTAPPPVDIAVALQWDGQDAPCVTAIGRGDLAQQIVELAAAHEVPISDDVDVVEVLAQVELGQPIPEVLFVAVAEVIAFAYGLRGHLTGVPAPAAVPPPSALSQPLSTAPQRLPRDFGAQDLVTRQCYQKADESRDGPQR